MRTLYQTMMSVALLAAMVFAVGAFHTGGSALAQEGHEGAQHGHEGTAQHEAASPEDHFHALIEHLELTDAQHEVLAAPFEEAFAAMMELHRLHEVIVAELTEEQQETMAGMVHEMMGPGPAERHGGERHGGSGH